MGVEHIPVLRTHEIIDFKRCQTKWYWKWRLGLVPKQRQFGALELGTWIHNALAAWYQPGLRRNGSLVEHFTDVYRWAYQTALSEGATSADLAKADELSLLGKAMMEGYAKKYGSDRAIRVIQSELPLELVVTDDEDKPIGVYKLKPDLVYRVAGTRDVWLMEHKTAASIGTGHLPIDDQRRAYGVLAEITLRKRGLLKPEDRFRGVLYNFLRKAFPDERETNDKGQALNKDGSVSARQPAVNFRRYPVELSQRAKLATLRRKRFEVVHISTFTNLIRAREIDPGRLLKTPHKSCERTCQFFTMCVAEEDGSPIRQMQKTLYIKRDPYVYDEDTTDEPPGFEMG